MTGHNQGHREPAPIPRGARCSSRVVARALRPKPSRSRLCRGIAARNSSVAGNVAIGVASTPIRNLDDPGNIRARPESLGGDRSSSLRKEFGMKALLLTIGALAATLSLAVGLSSASAANSSTVTGTKVAVAGTGLGKVLVDGRGRTLYLFAKDRRGKSSCTGKCAGVLAAADRRRQAARGSRGEGIPPRNHEARRRASSDHLQPPSALHIRQGHEAGPDKRRGSRRLRRRVVRRHSRRSKGREGRRDQQRRQRLPGSRRLRAWVLGATGQTRRGPPAGPLLNRAVPLAPPIQLFGWATKSVRPRSEILALDEARNGLDRANRNPE